MTREAAVVIIQAPSKKVLLLRRGSTAPHAPGHWNFPGGFVEEGESVIQGAVREVREETGFLLLVGPSLQHLFSYRGGGVLVHVLFLRVGREFKPTMPDGEHDAYLWTTLNRIPAPVTKDFAHLVNFVTRGVNQFRA
jgi:8-oxo-dGTP pyrophosphatase MutT (NUDIX family)